VTEERRLVTVLFADAVGSTTLGESHDPEDVRATAVTITIGVRPLTGLQTCPGIPGTPDLVRLAEPLGKRTLLDGGRVPPGGGRHPGRASPGGSGGSAGRRQAVRLWRGPGGGPHTRGTRRSP
jgi:hypothetical protein